MRVLTTVTGHKAAAATAREVPPVTNASIAVSLVLPSASLQAADDPSCTGYKQSSYKGRLPVALSQCATGMRGAHCM